MIYFTDDMIIEKISKILPVILLLIKTSRTNNHPAWQGIGENTNIRNELFSNILVLKK